jgi:ABC-type phosphate/phosphonate transport system ATPase subunit
VILADEPVASLDPETAATVVEDAPAARVDDRTLEMISARNGSARP